MGVNMSKFLLTQYVYRSDYFCRLHLHKKKQKMKHGGLRECRNLSSLDSWHQGKKSHSILGTHLIQIARR